MNNVILAKNFELIYFNILLILVILTWFLMELKYNSYKKISLFSLVSGVFLYFFTLIIIGLRPVTWYFGDMGQYNKMFNIFAKGWELNINKDFIFYSIMKALSYFGTSSLFFFVIAFLYITPLYIASKRLFKKYYYFAFLILVTSFEFWSYGVNGIRNGLATSIMILAFSYMNKKVIMYLLFLLAFGIHSSVLIPILAYFISSLYKSKTFYFKIWFVSIFVSYLIGNYIEEIITSLGIMDEDVVMTYFKNKDLYAKSFSHTGFRWDFLLYSSSAVIISYYFIIKKKFNDDYYIQLTNIYLLSNLAWILVIRASFSNRFAYLSWFMMGLIIIYPFLKQKFWKKQFAYVGRIILIYFIFTYIMKFIIPRI